MPSTVISTEASPRLMFAGTVMLIWYSPTRPGASQALVIAASLQFATYGAWVISHDDFRYVMYDYAAAMLW